MQGQGNGVNILYQSNLYFSSVIAPRHLGEQQDNIHKYSQLLADEAEPHSMMQLWQLPLGLLLALQSQPRLIESFFSRGLSLPQWYENAFIPLSPTALVPGGPSLGDWGNLSLPPHSPTLNASLWALPRFSPQGKDALRFRSNGFRCSTAELLIFLAFAPLSQLLPQSEWQSALDQLDLLLFELYNDTSCPEDLIRKEYRSGLQKFWTEHRTSSVVDMIH
ncbi:MAG: hypothetical protein AAF975_07915 [Spirochaetota bacterium]